MSRRAIQLISTLILIFSIAVPATASAPGSDDDPTSTTTRRVEPKAGIGASEVQIPTESPFENAQEGIFLIRLDDPPLASYRGGVGSLQATSPVATGDRSLDVNASESIAYVDYLEATHATFIARIEKTIGHHADVRFTYTNGNNGVAVWLTPDEASRVSKMPDVVFVQADSEREIQTDTGPGWIGAGDIWGTPDCDPVGGCGEGIIVGIIDTGINPSNPSFADVGGDGYDHTNPFGADTYVGVCDIGNAGTGEIKPYDASFPCNDKLIGAWGYFSVDSQHGAASPVDYDGHGSHTASTAAGNIVTATVSGDARSPEAIDISGVAPHANIIAYAGCCTLSALAASIDQAIADGVDVINYSIGASTVSDVWNDFDTVGFLNAREAGIFVATSAGNDGPGAATVGSPADAPWLTSVGASTHSRTWVNEISFSGGDAALETITGNAFTDAYGPATIVYAGDFAGDDGRCLTPFPAGTWTNNEIVVCDRGQIARTAKGANVTAGGAGGLVLANDEGNAASINADAHVVPASHVSYADGVALKTWLASGAGHSASITAGVYTQDATRADIIAGFSSRGENRAIDTVSPSVSAPGVDILAAYGINDEVKWDMFSGTSMASPHVAGAGALLVQQHPTWTPAQIQSALMLTGNTTVADNDAVNAANPFAMGSGVVVLGDANNAGLIMNETNADYLAADPSVGGDPKTLNIPSMADSQCVLVCSWERTVTATKAGTYSISTASDGAMVLGVTPTNLTLAEGESETITVTASVTGAPNGIWEFGEVTLASAGAPDSTMPVAVRPSPGSLANLTVTNVLAMSLTLTWDGVTGDQGVVRYDVYQDGEIIGSVPVDTTGDRNPEPLPPTYGFDVADLEGSTTYNFTVRALDAQGEVSGGQSLEVTTATDFVDDNSSVFEADIEWLHSAGITRGCNPPTNDQYCPEDNLTRGQLAAMIARGLDLPATSTDYFTDDDDSEFEADINKLAAAGITFGCNVEGTLYCPDGLVTRGEMAAMFDRALDLAPTATDHFTDDDGHLFDASINRLAEAGITRGCNPPTNDNYCPDDLLTRGQIAAFFRRALS